MKSRAVELRLIGDNLFGKKTNLHNLWQTIADNFYPERADFTRIRTPGTELASNLMTGMPIMARRDLANSFSAMLRPRGKPWFHARTNDERINNDSRARTWLDDKSDVLRRIMYDDSAQFIRATKQGDNDFAAFGQTAISIDLNKNGDGLFYRCRHLRDTAWEENDQLVIDHLHYKWKLSARNLVKLFPNTASQAVKTAAEKEPFKEIDCRHILVPSEEYDLTRKPGQKKHPFVCVYIDIENETILEETPLPLFNWVIPRWITVSGSQYAHSPATTVALPDARLLQQITLTLLEAGQKSVDPPMKGTKNAIQGGVNLFAGGVTWVDDEYDEKLGGALEEVYRSKPELQWGVDRENRVADLINKAFYLNYIQVPTPDGDMTATEFRGRVEEYVRNALPLFEPLEVEYNGGICDKSFEIALLNGAFGPPEDMPPMLRGKEIDWQFDSPLQAANERAKTQAYQDSAQLLQIAAQIDPMSVHDFNNDNALRDALMGTVASADWVVPKDEADQAKAAEGRKMAMQQAAQAAAVAGQAAQHVGKGAQDLQAGGIIPPTQGAPTNASVV